MNTINTFEQTIKAYLEKRASEDSLFAVTYAKENKNIKECCHYINSEAQKQARNNCAVISDDVVFSWAVHYYDEDDIKVKGSSNMRSEIKSSAPKTEAKQETPKPKSKLKKKEDVGQLSLF